MRPLVRPAVPVYDPGVIDSHCHLDCDAFATDRGEALARAAARGVTDIVVPAVDPSTWEPIRALAQHAHPRCHAAFGVHPVALPELDSADDDRMLAHLEAEASRQETIAIGECGLDTSIDLEKAPLARQEHVLRVQLSLARRLKLPVILHARGPGCYALLATVLESEPLPDTGGVVHSYGGGADLLRKFLPLPLFFGFAGPATYPNARKVRASIEAVPLDRLLAETDAPDQTPEPHRPGRSEPAFVLEVIDGLARAKGLDPTEMARVTAENARRLFRL